MTTHKGQKAPGVPAPAIYTDNSQPIAFDYIDVLGRSEIYDVSSIHPELTTSNGTKLVNSANTLKFLNQALNWGYTKRTGQIYVVVTFPSRDGVIPFLITIATNQDGYIMTFEIAFCDAEEFLKQYGFDCTTGGTTWS